MSGASRHGCRRTPGGVGQFLLGLLMTAIGTYLFLNQVQVTTSYWRFWGYNSFGLTLVPMLVGIGLLFFNGKSVAGWILTMLGFGIIVAAFSVNMDVYFHQTSLYNTLIMLILLAGGLGLIARSLRPHVKKALEEDGTE